MHCNSTYSNLAGIGFAAHTAHPAGGVSSSDLVAQITALKQQLQIQQLQSQLQANHAHQAGAGASYSSSWSEPTSKCSSAQIASLQQQLQIQQLQNQLAQGTPVHAQRFFVQGQNVRHNMLGCNTQAAPKAGDCAVLAETGCSVLAETGVMSANPPTGAQLTMK